MQSRPQLNDRDSKPSSTRFVGKPEGGVGNVFLTYFDYFFRGVNTNLGGLRGTRGGLNLPTPDKSSTRALITNIPVPFDLITNILVSFDLDQSAPDISGVSFKTDSSLTVGLINRLIKQAHVTFLKLPKVLKSSHSSTSSTSATTNTLVLVFRTSLWKNEQKYRINKKKTIMTEKILNHFYFSFFVPHSTKACFYRKARSDRNPPSAYLTC